MADFKSVGRVFNSYQGREINASATALKPRIVSAERADGEALGYVENRAMTVRLGQWIQQY